MRTRRSQFAISLAGGFLLLAGVLYGQQGARQPDLRRLSALYAELQSDDDALRDLATLAVLRDPDILAYPETKERLVQLLERLNVLIKRNFISRKGMPDGWGETIISPLIGTIPKLYHDELPERAFLALANTSYNPDSPFARWLGEHSRPYLAQVIDLAKPGDPNKPEDVKYGNRRQNAVALLAHLWNAGDKLTPPLTSSERLMIHSRIVSALGDPAFLPCYEAIQTLGRIGDASVIGILEEVSSRGKAMPARTESHSLGVEAQQAIEKIRQRTAHKQ
jgi:hypothetical protein